MKNKFYLILVALIFILSACEDDKNLKNSIIENNKITKIKTEEMTTLEEHKSEEKIEEVAKKKLSQKKIPKKKPPIIYSYKFENLKKQMSILDISNDVYNFRNIQQPIVIMNVMSTWCPPCRGQIPHLSKLQQKFKENVFVMATLVHDDISTEKLNKFIIAQKMLFYVSVTQEENLKFLNMLTPKLALSKDFPMPLTIVFVEEKYFTHYEGMIPEEMIESDIKQLLEKIKK